MRRAFLTVGLLIGIGAQPRSAHADPPAASASHAERVADRPAADAAHDETIVNVSAGGSLNTGNTRSVAGNLSARLVLRRELNVLTAELSAAYGRATQKDAMGRSSWQTNSENYGARLRYDRFLTEMDALFTVAGIRRDHFAGLDARVQWQLGYLRNFYAADKHRFWGEVGYDMSYDNLYPNPLLDSATMMPVDDSRIYHSARVFVGYDNHVSDAIGFLTGLECLINVEEPKDTRLTWKNELRSSIGEGFSLVTSFLLAFDNVPVPGTRKLDTTTTLNLTYSYEAAHEATPAAH